MNITLISSGLRLLGSEMLKYSGDRLNPCGSLNGSIAFPRRSALSIMLLLGFLMVLFVPSAIAQSTIEVRNATVTPEFGYGEFTYSAQIWLSGATTDVSGKFKVELRIYDNGVSIYSESSMERRLTMDEIQNKLSQTFLFGPYSFKDDFGVPQTDNASYEFIIYRSGAAVARTLLKGPIVEPPGIMGTPQFDSTPYFFRGISVSLGFKDMEGLTPAAHLEISGPLEAPDGETWTTSDVQCTRGGKNIYTCNLAQDLQSYRDGGNFSFKIVYNNLRTDPLIFGPYNITLLPYTPRIERLMVPKALDYTNFTIRAFVKDEGLKMVGGTPTGSRADLIIRHPESGENVYTSTTPEYRDGYAVFEWGSTEVPFSRSDVALSKNTPFTASLIYHNDNWNYEKESGNITFTVVEEVPRLELRYSPVVYVRAGETASQEITAVVGFSKGAGEMRFRLTGPGQDASFTSPATEIGGNRYQYSWQVSFDDRHVNDNYTLSLTFVHSTLEGGEFKFDDRFIDVVPVSVEFGNAAVTPPSGIWNDTYTYTLDMSTSVNIDVQLQTYNPCSREWDTWQSKNVSSDSMNVSWTVRPFGYECDEMAREGAKFRFKARFAGVDYSSKAYPGPSFRGGAPVLVSLDYNPVVYISEGSRTVENIRAVVEYTPGQGEAVLQFSGPGKSLDESKQGSPLGGERYQYDWSIPFTDADLQKNFTISLAYRHPSLGATMPLAEREIQVRPVYIIFIDSLTSPDSGRWNDTFVYSAMLNTSVEADVSLEVYNPCAHEWIKRGIETAEAGTARLNLTVKPFRNRCNDNDGSPASYRFVANFAGVEYESDIYSGPFITGGRPELAALDYLPVIYVSRDRTAYQVVRATVDSPLGPAKMKLSIAGPGKMFEQEAEGSFLGGVRYIYAWSVPFTIDNIGNHTISLKYLHPEVSGGGLSFPDQRMSVVEDEVRAEVPQLLHLDYSPILYVDGDETVYQNITADVFSPGGKGDLALHITGPDKDVSRVVSGEAGGESVYVYRWSVPFDSSNAGNIYRISTSYQLAGESYAFDDRLMSVVRRGGSPPVIWEPTLSLEYDRTVFIPPEGRANQLIRATINYSRGMGSMHLNLTGPDMDFEETGSGRDMGDGRYLYEWTVPFTSASVGKEYRIALAYIHDSLAGGEYRFADRYMQVKAAEWTSGEVRFSEATVTPLNGSAFTGFTYCVKVESDLSSFDVELLTQEPGSTSWKPGESVTYDGSSGTLCWPNVTVDGEQYGMAKFRFVSGTSRSDVFDGPIIGPVASINSTVSPSHGPLYSTDPLTGEIARVYTYTFTAEINRSIGGSLKEIKLEVYDPTLGSWLPAGSQTYSPSRTRMTFSVNFAELDFDDMFLGTTKYRFLAGDRVLGEFSGPTIDVNLKNEKMTPIGRNLTYEVEVRSSLPSVDLSLSYTKDAVNWVRGDMRNYQSSSQEWKRLVWENYPKYYQIEFEVV